MMIVCLVSCSCSPRRHSEDDVDFLASDAHVVVGDTRLVAPFIAMSGHVAQKPSFSLNRRGENASFKKGLEAFRSAASSPRNAPKLDMVEIRIGTYGWDDTDPSMRRICTRLRRLWSRSLCDNPWSPLRQAMPENSFFLTAKDGFAEFDHHGTVGGERAGDQLRSMRLKAGRASTACDRNAGSGTRFCTAAILVSPRLVAVWTVWDGKTESSARQAEREGQAIGAFVRDALGPTENFPDLFRTACRLRKPGSAAAPSGDFCLGPPRI
jgi:hypothetical protein